jgi:sec-independent protein translocase protein TatA
MGLDNPLHIAFLVVILLLVFGAKRLPEIGRSLGSGMREFKSPDAAARPAAPARAAARDGSSTRGGHSARFRRRASRAGAGRAPAAVLAAGAEATHQALSRRERFRPALSACAESVRC